MAVNLTGLTHFAEQGSLFDERLPAEQKRQERAKNLAVALDRLHTRFGEEAIRYGRSQ
jgi:DNA polymerase-4